MVWSGPTFRMVDGERIAGVWTHVWVRPLRAGGGYFVQDLFAYADGAIRGADLRAGTLDALSEAFARGRLAVADPAVERGGGAVEGSWTVRYPYALTPERFVVEARDEIERLNGRPTSSDLCWEALWRFHRDPSPAQLELLRAAYLAVPAHRRVFVLGDMDSQDRPLRILVTGVGRQIEPDGPVVTGEMYQGALDYLERCRRGVDEADLQRDARLADGPAGADSASVVLHETVYPRGWPSDPGLFMLRNEYPAAISFGGCNYPSIVHAYWALSAANRHDHDRIRDTPAQRDARDLGRSVSRRAGWPTMRVAVMAALLRTKFAQHPDAAAVLTATGDARISYTGLDSPFWIDRGPAEGRNWIGRLLELIRSELAADLFLAD